MNINMKANYMRRWRLLIAAVCTLFTLNLVANVITSKVTIEGGKACVFLSSCTPNFQSFQSRGDDGAWRDCGEEVELSLYGRARKRFAFRTINLFGVPGPEHHVE